MQSAFPQFQPTEPRVHFPQRIALSLWRAGCPVGAIPVWIDTLNTADRVNLLELYSRSVMLLELGRAADWVDLFELYAQVSCGKPLTARVTGNPPHIRVADKPAGARQFKGRAELLELGRRIIAGEFDLAAGDLKTPARIRHSLSDISLFADGAQGTATGYAHLTVTLAGCPDPARWIASGTYADRLRRCGAGCWRFESRVLTVDGVATNP
jgi:SnoaL-like domain